MTRALRPSLRHADEEPLLILRHIDVFLALVRFAEFADRARPVAFRLLVSELHQACIRDLVAVCGSIAVNTDACHRSRVAQLGFTYFHRLPPASEHAWPKQIEAYLTTFRLPGQPCCFSRTVANPPLLSPEDWWTFFAECHCGLVRISRAKAAHDRLQLILESALQFALQRAVEQALALAYGQGRTTQQCVGERLYFSVQRCRIDQAMEQPHLLGCSGIEDVCREDNLPCQCLSDEVWQQHARATRDHHAHARLDTPHAYSRRGDAKIACQGQVETTSDRVAINGRDGWPFTHQQAGEAL